MLHGAYLGTADWPLPGRDGPPSHMCSGIGCGGLAFPADLTVENHGEDHTEDLQREETRQRSKRWRRAPYSTVTEYKLLYRLVSIWIRESGSLSTV